MARGNVQLVLERLEQLDRRARAMRAIADDLTAQIDDLRDLLTNLALVHAAGDALPEQPMSNWDALEDEIDGGLEPDEDEVPLPSLPPEELEVRSEPERGAGEDLASILERSSWSPPAQDAEDAGVGGRPSWSDTSSEFRDVEAERSSPEPTPADAAPDGWRRDLHDTLDRGRMNENDARPASAPSVKRKQSSEDIEDLLSGYLDEVE